MFVGPDKGRTGSARHGGHDVDEMVQDPCCGVYVPMSRAVTVNSGGRTLHFCSEDCARKYAGGKCGG